MPMDLSKAASPYVHHTLKLLAHIGERKRCEFGTIEQNRKRRKAKRKIAASFRPVGEKLHVEHIATARFTSHTAKKKTTH